MPCCILKDMYLGGECSVQLSGDDTRYTLLCGALAHRYGAQVITSIDSRITNRQILVAGGVGYRPSTSSAGNEEKEPGDAGQLRQALRRGQMPRLKLS